MVFARPAQDLVECVDAVSARSVLDVGAGTGAAAVAASQAVRAGGLVVALDPSLGMLEMARTHGLQCVAGAVPALPFADAAFDRVIANFVLNHLRSCEASLADMARTLRPGGKLGVTVWGPFESAVRRQWRTVAESFAGREALAAALAQALPCEDWFYDPAHLRQAFESAGLTRITVETRRYAERLSIGDFLSLRQGMSAGRFLQASLDPEGWHRFQASVADEFRRRFADPLEEIRDVHVAVGVR
jgi:ubiquinone/menaquinone biosynthesis C-methylase UbiE